MSMIPSCSSCAVGMSMSRRELAPVPGEVHELVVVTAPHRDEVGPVDARLERWEVLREQLLALGFGEEWEPVEDSDRDPLGVAVCGREPDRGTRVGSVDPAPP